MNQYLLPALAAVALVVAQSAQAETLRFGTDPTYPPYEYKLPSGQLVGLDIDIGNALCAAAHVKCEWVEGSFDGLIAGLQSRKFDAINASLAATAARQAVMDFTTPLYPADIRLVAAKAAHLQPTAASLAGKRIGVLQGSTQAAFAKQNWAAHGVVIVEYQDQDSVYADLENGRLDGTLVVGAAAQLGFLAKPEGKNFELAGAQIVDPALLSASSVIGVRKTDAHTLQMLDAGIAQLRQNGTIDRLTHKYLGTATTTK
ncbi:Lysine/arginine/ornithine-binding periplasmic protein (plasmid) [Caballeronia sp. SBC1]|uniref:ABC transporter substrate-binding protein n=1 Tax=unclassified Caballeronia TaxID=2646786 RepID=UPI0013E10F04|nr:MULTISPECIES: ABC transporter substrate-binding protein [unclassified Caballeronia]QIE25895.1 Lysine/arginine/ornithine-binding periplasmic protein [Caballeronia sp. SBC2]QIN64792.1 Lysine/arginine/ornithine-binding periplasmic protein [Caballeronia sp. SBC1]